MILIIFKDKGSFSQFYLLSDSDPDSDLDSDSDVRPSMFFVTGICPRLCNVHNYLAYQKVLYI